MAKHVSVLLHEAVDALVSNCNGFYVDGTYGRGGHSAVILDKLSEQGTLLAIDKDPDAIAAGERRFGGELRISFRHGSFARLKDYLDDIGRKYVSGILLDLGVSSPQLETAGRGFSFLSDGPLDMRMDTSNGQSAADWLRDASEEHIAAVIREYGEEIYSKRIAGAIVRERVKIPIESTAHLANIVATAHPSWDRARHPATKSFQAIRIYINRELHDLDEFLKQVVDILEVGGRLVVISFHSLEDRRVKRFIREQQKGATYPRKLPIKDSDLAIRLVKVGRAIKPSKIEVELNNRARSAVMRIAERVA